MRFHHQILKLSLDFFIPYHILKSALKTWDNCFKMNPYMCRTYDSEIHRMKFCDTYKWELVISKHKHFCFSFNTCLVFNLSIPLRVCRVKLYKHAIPTLCCSGKGRTHGDSETISSYQGLVGRAYKQARVQRIFRAGKHFMTWRVSAACHLQQVHSLGMWRWGLGRRGLCLPPHQKWKWGT